LSYRKIEIRNRLISANPWLAELLTHLRGSFNGFRSRNDGWPLPPPGSVKRAMLRREGLRTHAACFVETGTYKGDTTWYLRNDFDKLYSFEVAPELALLARRRFSKWQNIEIIEGDSGIELRGLVDRLTSPVLFWLDGHYSAGMTGRGATDCPIWEELDAICSRRDLECSIFIDDARLFGVDPSYPSLGELNQWCAKSLPNHRLLVENDIVKVSVPGIVASYNASPGEIDCL
jgi:hypothetical protein